LAASAAEILIVEDDEVIMGTLAYNLSRNGFGVSQATSGAEALRMARKLRPDLILLDIMLPGESGIEVCERIRERDQGVMIVMITAKDAEEDKVRGFEAGADDYVTKPFGMKELVARINANLKRSETGGRGKIIEAGDLQLDTKNFTASVAGEPLDLRLKEFELLAALASTPGELRSREELAKEVWGHAGVGSSRTIDVHIRRIRASLEERSSYEFIHTARGLGYRFEAKSRAKQGPSPHAGSRGWRWSGKRAPARQPRRAAEGQQDPARLRGERLPRAQDPRYQPQAPRREPRRDPRRRPRPGAPVRRPAQKRDRAPRPTHHGPAGPRQARKPGADRLSRRRGRARRADDRAGPHEAGSPAKKDITLQWKRFGKAAQYTVRGDETQLTSMFTNLVENAVKYTPAGGRVEVIGGSRARR
jgi:DNA-binding response OmpR family regulator